MKIYGDLFLVLVFLLLAKKQMKLFLVLLRPVKNIFCFAQHFRKKVCFKYKLRFCFVLKLNILINVIQTFYFYF